MKQQNLIILIVGLVLLGLLLISETTNLSLNSLNPEESQNVEQPQQTENNPQTIQNPIENKEVNTEESSSNSNDLSTSTNSNST